MVITIASQSPVRCVWHLLGSPVSLNRLQSTSPPSVVNLAYLGTGVRCSNFYGQLRISTAMALGSSTAFIEVINRPCSPRSLLIHASLPVSLDACAADSLGGQHS